MTQKPDDTAQQPGIQSLERAFGLLELLSRHPGGLHLLEAAKAAGLHKSTAHRFLASLIALGYVRKPEETGGRYQLTLRLFELGSRMVTDLDLTAQARPALDRLCAEAGEAAHLVVRDGTDIVYIYKAENPAAGHQLSSRIGMRRPLYCTAAGKAILAALPEDEAARLWQAGEITAYTPHTLLSLPALQRDLAETRRSGFAHDREENELGVYCLAAAIRDYTGRCLAALSVSSPVARMTPERVARLGACAVETAREISAALGCLG